MSRRRSRTKRSSKKNNINPRNLGQIFPSKSIIRLGGETIRLPRAVLQEIKKSTVGVINEGQQIKILDPIHGIFKISGNIIEVPFNFTDKIIGSIKPRTPRRKHRRVSRFGSWLWNKRNTSKPRRRHSKSRKKRFGRRHSKNKRRSRRVKRSWLGIF